MSEQQNADAVSMVTIPKENVAPKPESKPSYKPNIKNFAGDEKIAKRVAEWTKNYQQTFDSQSAWDKFKNTDMDIDDEMYRAAKTRDEINADQDKNYSGTESNVASTVFYRTVRARTAGQTAVILGSSEDLPVCYEPMLGSQEYKEQEGWRIAIQQNMTLAYTMDVAKMREKIRQILLFSNKYGNRLIGMSWDYRKEKRKERVPTGFNYDEEGNRHPKGFSVKEVEKIIADWPILEDYDMRNVWFDALIENEQEWNCLVLRKQMELSDIWKLQRTNEFMNVGKITTAMLYKGEDGEYQILDDRQGNAGEDGDSDDPTTLFDMWDVWIRLPIDPETGKWDEDKILPSWYNAVFVGNLTGKNVCVKLSPNPHYCKKLPFKVIHTHIDDKGALHMSYGDLVKCLYEMDTTIFNQAFDNVRKRNKIALVAERGSISIRSKVLADGGNRIWWKKAGAEDPHELRVDDTTQLTVPLAEKIEDLAKETMGTNKPFLGEALGSRTSASEAISVIEQAIKPALEDTKYIAKQLLPFIAEWNMEMWRQYSDPRREIIVTQGNVQKEIKPAELWGPLNIRVVSIKKFQDSIIRRKEEDVFFAQYFPVAREFMSPKGTVMVLSQIAKSRGYDNVDDWWAIDTDFDAKHVAKSENDAIVFDGVRDFPKPEENHEAHLNEHMPFLAIATLSDDVDIHPDGVALMKQHIQMHKNFQEKQQEGQQAQAQGVPPRTNGEVVGDLLGAEGGGGKVGRPPEITNTSLTEG